MAIASAAMGTTSLNRNPAPCWYLDGIELGTGIDAITGETAKSGLDPGFVVKDVTSTTSSDAYDFRFMQDATALEDSTALGFASSITFPVDGVKISAKRSFDFTSTNQSSVSTVLIVFDWQRKGMAKQLSGAKLSGEAAQALKDSRDTFRNKYGDYYVHQINHMLKFTAVW